MKRLKSGQSAQETLQNEEQKEPEEGGELCSAVYQTLHGCCTPKLRPAVLTCTGPAQDQASLNSSISGGGTYPELLSYWRRRAAKGGRITLPWKLLVGCPCPNGSPTPMPIWAAVIGLSGLLI